MVKMSVTCDEVYGLSMSIQEERHRVASFRSGLQDADIRMQLAGTTTIVVGTNCILKILFVHLKTNVAQPT